MIDLGTLSRSKAFTLWAITGHTWELPLKYSDSFSQMVAHNSKKDLEVRTAPYEWLGGTLPLAIYK